MNFSFDVAIVRQVGHTESRAKAGMKRVSAFKKTNSLSIAYLSYVIASMPGPGKDSHTTLSSHLSFIAECRAELKANSNAVRR